MSRQLSRRAWLATTGAAFAGMIGFPLVKRLTARRETVFLAKNQRYDGDLTSTIRAGLLATGFQPKELRDKRVLLKPNLVEPLRKSPQLTTNPAIVLAAAEVFRGWGATVLVGEAPGHVRDTEMALIESGMQTALAATKVPFADLNYEEVGWVKNGGGLSPLDGFFFPRTVLEADLIVSLPKLKTHHWVGMTAAMKNLYGVIPGIKYGWPKNVLHHAGIPQTVLDINSSLPKTITIVDAILCMEGDGPIMGSAKPLGMVAVGTNVAAVDATLARVMGLNPHRISYLSLADGRIGPLSESLIEQRGESWETLHSPFQILDQPHLQELRAQPGEWVT
ncbi:MAG TPA: DUF362 domain-containing protein [Pirellulales bacterium]|jgi:uncharacterized protein (DUF362 family)|nr:DUF362 domain-containing protein [Pirellulales bacterium]